jgi:16S rRNA (guanine527-N7)-methyltransferase
MEKLLVAAQQLGLPVKPEHLPLFERYYRELVAWNQRFNLTAVTDYEQVQVRHFADSLTCLLASPGLLAAVKAGKRLRLADVGSGAGFPGLPIKIVWPQAELALIESMAKRCAFLEHVAQVLGLKGVRVLNMRAEEVGRLPEEREQYDVVMARAVADLPVLAEYLLPLVRLQGLAIAQKGEGVEEEVVRAERAIEILGGNVEKVLRVDVPGTALPRSLVVMRKVALTPARYPRRVGVPARRPLAVGKA